jgi:hypothetical protein
MSFKFFCSPQALGLGCRQLLLVLDHGSPQFGVWCRIQLSFTTAYGFINEANCVT